MSYQIYLLYRCNIHTIILFTKYFLFSSRSGSRRALLPRGRPTAYVGIVVLVGGGGGGGVIIAPAVVAKIARSAPAFAVGRSDATSRPPRHRVRRPGERPRRLILCLLPLVPPLVLRRRNVIGQHTLLDAGELGLGARGGYLPRSSCKHGGALPPCPKSCQNMTRIWDTSAKKISAYSCG